MNRQKVEMHEEIQATMKEKIQTNEKSVRIEKKAAKFSM